MKTKRYQFYFLFTVLAIVSLHETSANSPIPEFETTRMKSTAGAGVASILMDEATYLNPATIAYYNQGSFYFQQGGLDTKENTPNSQTQEFSNMSIIASDAKGSTGGSFSYNTINYKGQSIKQFNGAFARPIGKKSSIGTNITYSKENVFNESNQLVENDFKQVTIGVAHVISDSFTMGFVLEDPFKEKEADTMATAGVQYVYENFISLMLDAGANYTNNLSDSIVWRTGAQLKLFSDFYVRFGAFNDKGKQQKGNGAGIGWIQPKLVVEVALKNTDILESQVLGQNGEEIKETSFSLSYRF